MQTDVLPDIEKELTEFDGKAHYIRTESAIAGGPSVALCGKKFVPTVIAGALDLPVCKTCDELFALLSAWD